MSSVPIPLNAWKGELQRDNNGAYRKNMTNLVTYLRFLPDFARSLRFNEMAQVSEWQGKEIEEHDFVDMRLVLERENLPFSIADMKPAVDRVARDNAYSPVVEYLEGLVWDQKPRIDRWMISLLGAPDTNFVQMVSARSMIAAVARAFDPGCKVDTVLVLEGAQGISKSSAIKALFGKAWTVDSVSLFDKHSDMVSVTMGAWVVELAEFVAIVNSDNNSVKGLLSIEDDKVRLSYAARSTRHPRRFVFFATINPGELGYLTDNTGNRRYWPVPVTMARLDLIKAHRDQMWAEAVQRYRDNERWWLTPEEDAQARTVQSEREEEDAWTDPLREKLGLTDEIIADKAMELLGIPIERRDKRAQMRVTKALKQLGFEKVVERHPSTGKTRKIWRKK